METEKIAVILEPWGGIVEETCLCYTQSYVSHVTLSKSLPHSVLSCKMLRLNSWSIFCVSQILRMCDSLR